MQNGNPGKEKRNLALRWSSETNKGRVMKMYAKVNKTSFYLDLNHRDFNITQTIEPLYILVCEM